MIGDGAPDIQAGKAAGVHTCAVTYGLCSAEELLAARPDFTIGGLDELPAYID
jgi:phosphoglycolate phosphatase-like HAD superfamily hydrolase